MNKWYQCFSYANIGKKFGNKKEEKEKGQINNCLFIVQEIKTCIILFCYYNPKAKISSLLEKVVMKKIVKILLVFASTIGVNYLFNYEWELKQTVVLFVFITVNYCLSTVFFEKFKKMVKTKMKRFVVILIFSLPFLILNQWYIELNIKDILLIPFFYFVIFLIGRI